MATRVAIAGSEARSGAGVEVEALTWVYFASEVKRRIAAEELRYLVTWDDPMSMW